MTALAKPGDSLTTPTTSRSYVMAAPESTITEIAKDGTSAGQVTTTTLDGLGRMLCQTRQATSASVNIIAQRDYSARGHVAVDLLPRRDRRCVSISLSSAEASGRSALAPHWISETDALNRPVSRDHSHDSAIRSWSYDILTVTELDEEDNGSGAHAGTPTQRIFDGRGRVTAVVETNDSDGDGIIESYDTTYTHTPLDLLASVTESRGEPTLRGAL